MKDTWKLRPGFKAHNDKGAVREVVRVDPKYPFKVRAGERKIVWKTPDDETERTSSWTSFVRWAKGEWLEPRPDRLPVPTVSDVEMAFPTGQHTPPWRWVPDEFRNAPGGNYENPRNPWVRLVRETWSGTRHWKDWQAIPKEGVDAKQAFRAIQETLGNWGIKHEHKLATAGWMLSEWFVDFWWVGDTHTAIHQHQLSEWIDGWEEASASPP
jgi:hypothetical protein